MIFIFLQLIDSKKRKKENSWLFSFFFFHLTEQNIKKKKNNEKNKMPVRFSPKQTDFKTNSRRQSPVNYDNDRYTPPPDAYTRQQNPPSPPIKTSYQQSRNAPEIYHVDTKHANPRSNYDDEPSSPLVRNAYSPARTNAPELYHLNDNENHAQSMNDDDDYHPSSSSPPIRTAYTSSQTDGPELYHLSHNENNNNHDPPPPPSVLSVNNRASPTFPTENKIELYSLKANDNEHLPLPSSTSPPLPIHKTTRFDETTMADHEPGKITMYSLKSENRENQSPIPGRQRTPPPYVKQIASSKFS